MKLQYKNQKFQEDAVRAVVNVFKGQPKQSMSYLIDQGYSDYSEPRVLESKIDVSIDGSSTSTSFNATG